MQLDIHHVTSYLYDEPVERGLQRLRLTPLSNDQQTISSWSTTVTGGDKELSFIDHLGNFTELVGITPGTTSLEITSSGTATTSNQDGIIGATPGFAPRWLFMRQTPLTEQGSGVASLAAGLRSGELEDLHALSARIRQVVEYAPGQTSVNDTAESAIRAGVGVCQDHAHVFISAARSLGVPARYVSGYLMMNHTVEQNATHAWAEAWVDGLGWVGFDPSNAVAPDERYVRIAVGVDYNDAGPVSGVRFGTGQERLEVTLRVQQQQQ